MRSFIGDEAEVSNTPDMQEYFTPLHHQIAEQLGYRQTPGYASWDKVEETAPVQAIDRLVQLFQSQRLRDRDALLAALPEELPKVPEHQNDYINKPYIVGQVNGHNQAIDDSRTAITAYYRGEKNNG